MKYKLFLLWLPATAVMCMIFGFSQMPAEESSHLSGGIVETLLQVFDNHEMTWLTEHKVILDNLEFLIRKAAHASEYALLGITLVIPFAYHVGLSGRHLAGMSILTAALYACTDEFHQLFITGRSARFFDVGVDTLGACIGVLLCMLITKRLRRRSSQVQHEGAEV